MLCVWLQSTFDRRSQPDMSSDYSHEVDEQNDFTQYNSSTTELRRKYHMSQTESEEIEYVSAPIG